MALHVTVDEVQQWFEKSKLEIGAVDGELEATAVEQAFSRLSSRYDVTGWTDSTTTPRLVRKVLSMLVAAWTYDRQYSEEDPDGNAYARRLEERATYLLDGIVLGAIDLLDIPGTSSADLGAPLYYPDDATGRTQQYDDMGYPVGSVDGAARKFSMGMMF